MQQPGLYRHPSPFSTNPYWGEEIVMGPGPMKKSGSKNGSQNPLSCSGGQGSSYAGSTAMGTDAPSSPTAVDGSRISGEGWNTKRYQREDEGLWGIDFHAPSQRFKEAIAKAGESASRLLESKLSRSGDGAMDSGPEKSGTYYGGRNPPVNDLHPPVVSTQPSSRDEARWMLQPPPSAKIMEGKERVVRNRADSNGSSRSRRGADEPLSRQVTGKLVDAKLQSGELYPDRPSSSRKIKTPTTIRPRGPRYDRNRSPSPHSSSEEETRIRRKRRPQPIPVSGGDSDDSLDSPQPRLGYSSVPARSESKRPSMPTIMSSSRTVHQEISMTSTSNTELDTPLNRLSPNANSMPATIWSGESKFPGDSYRFPRPASRDGKVETENQRPLAST